MTPGGTGETEENPTMSFESLTFTSGALACKLLPVAQKAFPVVNNAVLNTI